MTENVQRDESSGGRLLHGVQRGLRGIHNDFLGGLNQKGDGGNGSKARGTAPSHSPIGGYDTLRIDGGPQVSGSIPKGIPFLFMYKEE